MNFIFVPHMGQQLTVRLLSTGHCVPAAESTVTVSASACLGKMAAAAVRGLKGIQLRQLTLCYCRTGGSSDGMREFIEHDLVGLAVSTPEVRRNRGFPYSKSWLSKIK